MLAAGVHMRPYAKQLCFLLKPIVGFHAMVHHARWYNESARFVMQESRLQFVLGWRILKFESQSRAILLRFTGRRVVHLHNQILTSRDLHRVAAREEPAVELISRRITANQARVIG